MKNDLKLHFCKLRLQQNDLSQISLKIAMEITTVYLVQRIQEQPILKVQILFFFTKFVFSLVRTSILAEISLFGRKKMTF